MQRRSFLTLLGGAAAAWPLAARAQQGSRLRRIGVLSGGAEDDPEYMARLVGFRQGLEKLGWSEGRNVRIDYLHASASAERTESLAKEAVAQNPEVILAGSSAVAAALQREGSAIPIVFVSVSDPIGSGFIASLARPGGNLTGLMNFEASIVGKWLAMLKEIAPQLRRVTLLGNPKTSPYDYFQRAAEAPATTLAISLVASRIETAADIERAIESFAQAPNGGLVVPPDVTTTLHRELIARLAALHRLPAVYAGRYFVSAGGLMSYDTDRVEMFRQAAYYVDRILRGDKPSDLPVQAPVKYETVINLKTANALGLTVPDLMIVRADEVIE